jgi:NADPH-dependent 2,4-dienoyl-CoA reductase/sulfur reductase-like enzyme
MESRVDPMSIAGKEPAAAERFPIVVVGAGPAGCAAATEAAGRGLPVLLVDEHPVEPGLIGLDVPYHFGQRADGSVRNRGRMLERVVETNPALAEAFKASRSASGPPSGGRSSTARRSAACRSHC